MEAIGSRVAPIVTEVLKETIEAQGSFDFPVSGKGNPEMAKPRLRDHR
jgi:hypothetical protein